MRYQGVVDSALALGILMHEFGSALSFSLHRKVEYSDCSGWQPNQYDHLCMGTLAGHLIECSAQCTGGLFTDYQDLDTIARVLPSMGSA